MLIEQFLRDLFETGRFKTSQNLMDRKITIQLDGKDCEIVNVSVDYVGDVVVEVEEA